MQKLSVHDKFIAGLMIVYVGAFIEIVGITDKVVAWLAKGDAPAWVQGVGSVLAIVASIWISHHQNRVAQRVERGREMAICIRAVMTLQRAREDGAMLLAHFRQRRQAFGDRWHFMAETSIKPVGKPIDSEAIDFLIRQREQELYNLVVDAGADAEQVVIQRNNFSDVLDERLSPKLHAKLDDVKGATLETMKAAVGNNEYLNLVSYLAMLERQITEQVRQLDNYLPHIRKEFQRLYPEIFLPTWAGNAAIPPR